MDLDKIIMTQAYKPFLRLAIYNFGVYTFFIGGFNVFFFVLIKTADLEGEFPWLVILIVYLILCIKALWLVILVGVERKVLCFSRKLAKIKMIETDGLFGNYKNANQEIKKCYPNELAVERNKIICKDEDGIKYKFRLIGSRSKMQKIQEWLLDSEESVYFTYGKLTKIILFMELAEPRNSIKYNRIKMLNYKF